MSEINIVKPVKFDGVVVGEKGKIRYWTNTKSGELRFERVSGSAIQIFKGKQFIGSVEPTEFRIFIEKIIPFPKDYNYSRKLKKVV